MSQQLKDWLDRLSNKVQAIEYRLDSEAVEQLEGEANTCKAWLRQLYDYARAEQIDIGQYYDRFVGIERSLSVIERELAVKAERAEWDKRPWWAKVWHVVREALAFAADILGLAPLANRLRLPSGPDRKLLT